MKKRYFIDERVGCIAVRDRTLVNPEENCLQPDWSDVVKYWEGKRVKKICPTCKREGIGYWEVKEEDRKEAEKLCNSLNEQSNKALNQTEGLQDSPSAG